MVVQAVAAERLALKSPEAALASVAEVGRTALVEMRRIFDIFEGRSGPVDFTPQPTLADLDAMIDTYRTAGMGVTVRRDGEARVLDAGTELSIVRIVQESLTNVLKHTNGAEAVVTLTFAKDVAVEITDSGRAPTNSRSAGGGGGGGRGLIGMRERVDALGGTLTARPLAARGFTVCAVLPGQGSSVNERSTPASGRS